jgi:hypothetical protein
MDGLEKLRITNKARSLQLWDAGAKFKETQRSVLRRLGVPKPDAIRRAWQRLEFMLDHTSSKQVNPFANPLDLDWRELHFDSAPNKDCDFNHETAWAFIHFRDEDAIPPTSFAEQVVELGVRYPKWLLVEGSRYFSAIGESDSPLDTGQASALVSTGNVSGSV